MPNSKWIYKTLRFMVCAALDFVNEKSPQKRRFITAKMPKYGGSFGLFFSGTRHYAPTKKQQNAADQSPKRIVVPKAPLGFAECILRVCGQLACNVLRQRGVAVFASHRHEFAIPSPHISPKQTKVATFVARLVVFGSRTVFDYFSRKRRYAEQLIAGIKKHDAFSGMRWRSKQKAHSHNGQQGCNSHVSHPCLVVSFTDRADGTWQSAQLFSNQRCYIWASKNCLPINLHKQLQEPGRLDG
jgi:hypothetical protein